MNINLKILSIAIVAVLIVGGGLFFTKEEKQNEEIVTIRGSVSTSPTEFEIATKLTGRDILKEEGVKFEPVIIQGSGGTVTMQALLANNLDVASGTSITVWVNAISNGAKVKLLYPDGITDKETAPFEGLLVLENSSINTIKDLAGKKIAVNVLGAGADFKIRKLLKQNGLSKDQVQLVVVPMANQEMVLRSKQVDVAAWGATSGGTEHDMAVEKGGVRKIPGTTTYEAFDNQSMIVNGVGFREDFIQEHPEAVKRYVKAVDSAKRLVWEEYRKDPERVKRAYADIAEEKGGNPKLAKYYRGPRWSSEHQFITERDIQFWIDYFVEDGILKPGQIKASDVYTNEFNPYYKS